MQVAQAVGVSLADETDKDKAFRASHQGKVFGISYDLERWVWSLSEDKLVPLVISLSHIKESDTVENGTIMSVNGKLNHYMWLVPGGPWQRGFLIRLQDSTKPPTERFKVDVMAKEQASWWLTNLRAACEESKILDPRPMGSMVPIHVYTDAAGGDASKIKNGAGAFIPPSHWAYMPWPELIRDNRGNVENVGFAHKLCSIE